MAMLMTTTPSVEGKRIVRYLGVVTGETIIGANVFRDFLAGVRDFFGGRSGSYEAVLREAKDTALEEMARQAEALAQMPWWVSIWTMRLSADRVVC